jgi:hypothetical protein
MMNSSGFEAEVDDGGLRAKSAAADEDLLDSAKYTVIRFVRVGWV